MLIVFMTTFCFITVAVAGEGGTHLDSVPDHQRVIIYYGGNPNPTTLNVTGHSSPSGFFTAINVRRHFHHVEAD